MDATRPTDENPYELAYMPDSPLGLSPYRLRDRERNEVHDVNEFLDAQATRGLSPRSLRAYGYSLLNFWRWHSRTGRELARLAETDLLEYIRYQQRQNSAARPPAPTSMNRRLTAVRLLYRFHTGSELPPGRRVVGTRLLSFHNSAASGAGYLHPSRPRRPPLWVREPRRVVAPLSAGDVATFLESFDTTRDLAIVGFLLLCGLRSRELIELRLEDLDFAENQVRVHGKGNRDRVVPLAPQVLGVLRRYLEIERPPTRAEEIFVSLKGRRRGRRMTASGLRSLFRHHRGTSGVSRANPHRFRHTFGSDMVRAGISLPALMKLMGHAYINTTMIYVQLSPKDVFDEFQRVAMKLQGPKLDPPHG
jgi:site-specific recombinase XerD